jgi:hypothetical protein
LWFDDLGDDSKLVHVRIDVAGPVSFTAENVIYGILTKTSHLTVDVGQYTLSIEYNRIYGLEIG